MELETSGRLFNLTLQIVREKGIDLSSAIWEESIKRIHIELRDMIEIYIDGYNEEFCLLDKLQMKEIDIYIEPFNKFPPIFIDEFFDVKRLNPKWNSTYAILQAQENILLEFDKYMEKKFCSLKEKQDYSNAKELKLWKRKQQ